MNFASFSMNHVYILLALATVAYWMFASTQRRAQLRAGAVSFPDLVTTTITSFIQPFLIAVSVVMGIMVSTNLHNHSVSVIKIFGTHIPEMSFWMGTCLDLGITALGIFLPALIMAALDTQDVNNDYHIDDWMAQIIAFEANKPYASNGGTIERKYVAWGLFTNPTTKKLTPVAKLIILYLLTLVTVITLFMFKVLSIFAVFTTTIMILPVLTSTFGYFTYHAHGTREKLIAAIILVSSVLVILCSFVAYYFYQYLYLYPYQSMVMNPSVAATYYLGTSNGAVNGIVNGKLTAEAASAILGQLNLTLTNGFVAQVAMLLIDAATGILSSILGGGASILKIISLAERAGALITTKELEKSLTENEDAPVPPPTPKPKRPANNTKPASYPNPDIDDDDFDNDDEIDPDKVNI